MSRIAKTPVIPAAAEEQRILIKLLGDDDALVFDAVKKKIISYGPDSLLWLRPLCLSDDGILRKNVRNIVHHFDLVEARRDFTSYCLKKEEQLDLERGLFMLAKTKYPEINIDAYCVILDNLAADLKIWLRKCPDEPLLERVNKFLFEEKGFVGNMEGFNNPENNYINRAIDLHTGSPTTLCLLYVLILRRLVGVRVQAIGMPGHALCAFYPGNNNNVIYVDVFNLGKLLTRQDCINHLNHSKYVIEEKYLAPMSIRRSLARVCGNLEMAYVDLGKENDAARFRLFKENLET